MVKESRGWWSYLLPGRKKPIRGRMLRDDYEKEAVLRMFADTLQKQPEVTMPKEEPEKEEKSIVDIKPFTPVISTKLPDYGEIGHLIDIENNPKIKESEAYLQWAKIHNLLEQSKTFNYMWEHGLLAGTQLDEELEVLHAAFDQAKTELKATEARLKEVNRSLRLLGQYYHTKEAYLEYKKSKNKKVFHEEQYKIYRQAREKWMEVGTIVRNRDSFLAKLNKQEREDTT